MSNSNKDHSNKSGDDKLDMQSPDLVNQKFEKLAELFPNCVTESATGKAIDFDLLKQELNHAVVEGNKERYRLEWPGKREAIVTANLPTTKTLRPVREDSVDFDNTKNVYIEGDNLEVLKVLQESYLNKIKMIYIDPPYNTGNDIIYKNNFYESEETYKLSSGQKSIDGLIAISNVESNGKFHSNWLNMMYPRLKIARNLLREDGIAVIAIDHNELNTLTSVCDEVFGITNRIGLITVVHKPEGRNQAKFFGPSNEFMLFYAKDVEACNLRNVVIDDELMKSFDQTDNKGPFKLKNFIRLSDGKYSLRINKPSFYYPVYINPVNLDISLDKNEIFSTEIFPITDAGQERTWKTTPNTLIERHKNGDILPVLENGKWGLFEKLRENQVLKTHWLDKKYHGFHFGTKVIDDLLDAKTFDFPKSVFLMQDVLKLVLDKNDTVIDFFSGSATTAHALLNLNVEDQGSRRFVLVQLPEPTDDQSEAYKAGYKNICEIGKERIRRAAKKINVETNADIDYGFRVYRLDESNMQDVYYRPQELEQSKMDFFGDNIKPDRTEDDLLAQVMLDWGLPLNLKIEQANVAGKNVFKVAENSLFACFDKGIDEAFAKEIAKEKPLRIVFKDAGFKDDTSKTNVKQLLKQLSPETEMKVL
jgi:adenine-specific DNA-methyltransferase